MTFIQKTLLTVLLTLAPAAVYAVTAPSNIKHVAATITNGALTVTWDAAQDAMGVDFYRVYYSHASILGNGGNYDDFERTKAADTTYTFSKLPLTSKKIFVSVLAVNKAGTESEGFEAEASVDVPTDMPPTASASSEGTAPTGQPDILPSSVDATTAVPMEIVSVSAASDTGVLVTFSKPLATAAPLTSDFFVITDASGTVLAVTMVEVTDAQALIHTAHQEPGRTYTLTTLQPIAATDGTNLPTAGKKEPFRGFGEQHQEMSSSASSVSSLPVASLPYGRNPALGTPVTQAYGKNPALNRPVNDAYGRNPALGQLIPRTDSKHLPKSGIGLLGIFAISGAAAARARRRKNMVG